MVGGTSAWIRWLLPELNRRGIESDCLCFLHTGEKGPTVSHLERNGVRCSIYKGSHTIEDRVEWIHKEFAMHRPKVFVPNEVPAAYHAIGWLKQRGVRCVGVIHAQSAAAYAMPKLFAGPDVRRALDAVVCVSKEIERDIRKSPPPYTSVHRIPCGAPVPDFRAQFAPHRYRLIYSGRLTNEQKRITHVARALCDTVKEVPGTEAIVFGDGPQRDEVERIFSSDGRGLPVKLAGYVEPEEMQAHYAEAHSVILLSEYEGLPVSLMEAMACGCVPICRKIHSGVPELVQDGITGILVGDDPPQFVEAVRQLRQDGERWNELSRGARRLIEKNYSHTAASDLWVDLLEELLRKPSVVKLIKWPVRMLPPSPPFDYPAERRPQIHPLRRAVSTGRSVLGRLVRHAKRMKGVNPDRIESP